MVFPCHRLALPCGGRGGAPATCPVTEALRCSRQGKVVIFPRHHPGCPTIGASLHSRQGEGQAGVKMTRAVCTHCDTKVLHYWQHVHFVVFVTYLVLNITVGFVFNVR